jgi:hypothetical protein
MTASTIKHDTLDPSRCQVTSTDDISALLSSLRSSSPKSFDELLARKSSFNERDCEFCSRSFLDDDASSNCDSFVDCVHCASFRPTSTFMSGGLNNQRDIDTKERLKIKLTKRIIQNTVDPSKTISGKKSRVKPLDNNIDELVRFIDGHETVSEQLQHSTAIANKSTSSKKKNKNKKTKKTKQPMPNVVDDALKTQSSRQTREEAAHPTM